MSFLSISSREELAEFFGERWSSSFARFLYGGPMARHYYQFEIKKRDGSGRLISAPREKLKKIQRQLHVELVKIYKPTLSAAGFCTDRGILWNASRHVGRSVHVCIDLENFFPSIHFGRVRGMFAHPPFGFPTEVATTLAHICCVDKALPQGSPASPVISNIICRALDKALLRVARQRGLFFTRYVDDLTFSGSRTAARQVAQIEDGIVVVAPEIVSEIGSAGFSINHSKLRILTRADAMVVTGIVTNEKPNVRRGQIRRIRSFLHRMEVSGLGAADEWYLERLAAGKVPGARAVSIENYVRGYLQHVRGVRGRYDALTLKYLNRFNAISSGRKFNVSLDPSSIEANCFVIESNLKIVGSTPDPCQGTAFLLTRKLAVTNSHCVGKDTFIYLPNNPEKKIRAWLVCRCDEVDLAILRVADHVDGSGMRLSSQAKHEVGDDVRVYGYPSYGPGSTLAISSGQVVQKYMHFGRERLRVSCPIISGNSGGPVTNYREMLVGIAVTGRRSFDDESNDARHGVIGVSSLCRLINDNLEKIKKIDHDISSILS